MTKQKINEMDDILYKKGERMSMGQISMATKIFEKLQSAIIDPNTEIEMLDDGRVWITNDNVQIIVNPRGDKYKIDTFVGETRSISLTPRGLIEAEDAVKFVSDLVKAQKNIPVIMDILNSHTEGEDDMEPAVHSDKFMHVLKNAGIEPEKEESVEDVLRYFNRNSKIEPGDHKVTANGYPLPTKEDRENFGRIPASSLQGLRGKVVTKPAVKSAALDLMGAHRLGLISLNENRDLNQPAYSNTMDGKVLRYVLGEGCIICTKEQALILDSNKGMSWQEVCKRSKQR